MAPIDEQLVRRITEQVVAALGQARPAQSASAPAAPAQVRPPAGVCTGDYSKFVELRGQGRPAAAPPASEATPAPQAAPALTGIVTAEQLENAMKSAADGVAVLAADARLTPLAQDFAREKADKIRRLDRTAATAAGTPADRPWFWWADGHCPVAQEIVSDHREVLQALTADRSQRGLLHVARELARRVKEERATGGVIFVHNAALAACFLNRCRSLRAVVGTRVEAVEEAIRDLYANVLIIEYPTTSPHAMRQMVQRFLQSRPQASPQLARDLRDLEEGS